MALYQLGGGDGLVLLDSEPTHALRPAKDLRELQAAKPVTGHNEGLPGEEVHEGAVVRAGGEHSMDLAFGRNGQGGV